MSTTEPHPTGERMIEAMGFGVRELPLPARLDGVAYALVAAEHGRERPEPSGAAIRLLAVSAGRDPAAVRWRLAARAAALRLGRGEYGVGAGPTRPAAVRAAVCSAICAAVERRPPPAAAARLTGWAAAVPAPLHQELDAELDCYLFEHAGGPPVVGAVLRRGGRPREIRALGCAPTARGAVRRALDGVLAGAAVDAWTVPAETPAVTGEVDLGRVGDVPEDELGSRVGAAVRTVLDGGGGVVVQCRLATGAAAPPEPWAEPGPWAAAGLAGRPAPAELTLGCAGERVRISRIFHENSKIRTAFRTLPPVEIDGLDPRIRNALGRPYRDYGRTRTEHRLPAPVGGGPLQLDEAVRRRRSASPMSRAPLRLPDLARILDLSAGVTGVARAAGGVRLPLRATPSAGGLCSTDLFVLARRVDGLRPGVYYFHPGRRVLQLVTAGYSFEEVAAHTGHPRRVAEAAAIVLYVAAFRRNQWKYWERGYRMALLDCGHLAQSVVIAAAALGLVAHPLIGFVDDYFNRLVGVNGTDDAMLYLTLLGEAAS